MNKFQRINNPYTLQFSYIPPQYIERTGITNEIIENFVRDIPTYRGIFITGVRGSGKTVMLGDIRNKIAARKDWITIDLNPESDLLDSLAHMLYQIPGIKPLFVKANLDLSALGIGVSLERTDLIASNEEDALRLMLQVMKKSGKKLLVTIDEVTYSKDVAKFSHALSSYASQDLDVFVLLTGLKENIDNIKNKKSLTFLYRAKIYTLETLNSLSIENDYKKTLELDVNQARTLAYMTKGYSLAFQAIGYHCWNVKCDKKDKAGEFFDQLECMLDVTLSEFAYEKIWDELSEKDKEVLQAIEDLCLDTGKENIRVDEVRKKIQMTSDSFTTYRKRLIDAGIINGKMYGYVAFSLPRFGEYVLSKKEPEDGGFRLLSDEELRVEYEGLSDSKKRHLIAYLEMLKKK